jgi:branched-chain amino acid transport system permease protein
VITQLLANSLISAFALALSAVGFALVYNTTRVFHFAHGAVYTASAYAFYVFYTVLGLHAGVALPLTFATAIALGLIMEGLIYRPLADRGSSHLVQMLSSLALYIVVVNLLVIIFGNDSKVLTSGAQGTFLFGGVTLTGSQIATLFVSAGLLSLMAASLKFTPAGRLIKGMRDDSELLSSFGVSTGRVRHMVFALGSLLTATSSLLTAVDVGFDPHGGLSVLMTSVVAVVVGGAGSFGGAAWGALLLGAIQGLVIWKMPAKWQDCITFVCLLLFLVFRPQGLLSRMRRAEEEARA